MLKRFTKRSHELERLDTGDYTSDEYRRWQKEMRYIHRIFGEMRALRRTLFHELDQTDGRVSVLDVGAGSGELLRELKKWTDGRDIFLTGVEINRDATLSIQGAKVSAVQANALRLPFDEDSFDFVFSSLFLHHLDDENAVRLLKEKRRVAKRRIYTIDLNRSAVAYYFYKTFGRLFLQRFTVEDGALSILRSRTPEELTSLAEAAGLRDIKVEHSRINRLILSGI